LAQKSLKDEDMVVFIIDDNNVTGSVAILQKMFSNRLNTSAEFWLIDVGAFESEDELKAELTDMTFDLNDDVFLYSHDKDIIYIWEVYKINSVGELIILNHGNWSVADGLMTKKENKWKRRLDLQVNIYNNMQQYRVVNNRICI
jgi:hypothetical protein